jgi:hypothetical protein
MEVGKYFREAWVLSWPPGSACSRSYDGEFEPVGDISSFALREIGKSDERFTEFMIFYPKAYSGRPL